MKCIWIGGSLGLRLIFLATAPSVTMAEEFPFVVAADGTEGTAVDFSHLSHKPAGADGFVRVADGHFATEAGRVRIWGVNLAFGANFPSHADAERIAAHLATLGLNGVRFHHYETQFSPKGLLRKDGSIDPGQMDRMDYFLAQLHRHGIYANLNLHVGQTPSKRFGWPPLGTKHDVMHDKHALHFQPEIQDALFKFWRELLTHKNPYRGLTRVQDPGIAMLEISNENRFVDSGPRFLQSAPEPYKSTILARWNDWLLNRYRTAEDLQAAWRQAGDGRVSPPQGQTMETGDIGVPDKTWSKPAQTAFLDFMRDTELVFYQKARKFLVDELGARVPITSTQANYQQPEILNTVADFADLHAYWHHPIFHGDAWSGNQWSVQNEPLVEFPFHNKWPRCNPLMRTVWRIHGKPFTFSEWNAGDPNFFSAGAIPIAALLASLQDWDAVFFYNYHSKQDAWDADHVQGYFQINGQPCKTVLLTAFAPLFRRADLVSLKRDATAAYGQHETLGALAFRRRVGIVPGIDPEQSHPAPTAEQLTQPDRKYLETPDGNVSWDARDPQQAHIIVNTAATRAVWGRVAGTAFTLGTWQFTFGTPERDYAIVVATSRDDAPLESSRSILIAAVGHAENQEMGWNQDHTSVGKQWGTGPTVANGIPLELHLPASQQARHLFALNGRGERIAPIPVKKQLDGSLKATLGPQWKTLWYELSVED